MKRSLAIGLTLIATTAVASVAEAAIQKGSFRGQTDAKDPLGFTVPVKNRVSDFFFSGVHMTCSDGDKFDTGKGPVKRLRSPSGVQYKISSKRKFKIDIKNTAGGNGWTARGKFGAKGKAASGTLTVYANFNDQNEPDQNGTIKCKSANLKWTAERK